MSTTTYLALSWGVSRGRETYGYNIRRLRDQSTGKFFRCMGGGYDMTGTVLADWALATYPARLADVAARSGNWHGWLDDSGEWHRDASGSWVECTCARTDELATHDRDCPVPSGGFYGLGYLRDEDRASLDGACGESSVWRVLNAAGIRATQRTWDRNGNTTGWFVEVST